MRNVRIGFLFLMFFGGTLFPLLSQTNEIQFLLGEAQFLIESRHYEQADKTLREAYAKSPRHAGVHFQFGRLFEILGNFPVALNEYKTALALSPSLDAANQGIARCSLRLQKIPQQQPPTQAKSPTPWVEPARRPTPPAVKPDIAKPAPKAQDKKSKWSGKFNADLQDRNEKYTPAGSSYQIPDKYNPFKLSLKYQVNDQHAIYCDEKYVYRRRNEPVHENLASLRWLWDYSANTTFSLKDSYNYVTYPSSTLRNFSDNLAEAVLTRKFGRYELLHNLGYEHRSYPNYLPSDFSQFNLLGDSTYSFRNGTFHWDSKWNQRNYDNSGYLDYDNYTLAADFNQSYPGNNSEISITNVLDKRDYGNEAVAFFRTNYLDDYFSFRYDLPTGKKGLLIFEDEYQNRSYPSNTPLGFSNLRVKTTGKWELRRDTRLKLGHHFIYNDENTGAKTYRDNIFDGWLERRVSESLKIKVEDQFQTRNSLIGNLMNFSENQVQVKTIWNFPESIELIWRNEYLARYYSSLFYSDYKSFTSGILADYTKPKKYDWQFIQDFRSMKYRNGANIATFWTSARQSRSEMKLNYCLLSNLKLKLLASVEKTFNRFFDSVSQEMLWNFTLPMTVTEFSGGLEYQFN